MTTLTTTRPPARHAARRGVLWTLAAAVALTAGYLGGRTAWSRVPGDYRPVVIVGLIIVAGAVVKRTVGWIASVLLVAVASWAFVIHPALTDLSDRAHHLVPSVPSLHVPSVHVPDVGAAARDAQHAVGGAVAGASSAASRVSGAVDGATDQAKRLTGGQP